MYLICIYRTSVGLINHRSSIIQLSTIIMGLNQLTVWLIQLNVQEYRLTLLSKKTIKAVFNYNRTTESVVNTRRKVAIAFAKPNFYCTSQYSK